MSIYTPAFMRGVRWFWQRRRKAYRRPVYSNGQQPSPRCEHRWRTEDRRPPGINAKSEAWRKQWHINVICTRCRAMRCGDSTDPNPCVRQRHHRGSHALSGPNIVGSPDA